MQTRAASTGSSIELEGPEPRVCSHGSSEEVILFVGAALLLVGVALLRVVLVVVVLLGRGGCWAQAHKRAAGHLVW
jgi:hypothetical protein